MDRFDKMLQKKLVDSARAVGYHRTKEVTVYRTSKIFGISMIDLFTKSWHIAVNFIESNSCTAVLRVKSLPAR